jgi:hypothetical protein
MINSRRISRSDMYVVHMEKEEECIYMIFVGNPESDH